MQSLEGAKVDPTEVASPFANCLILLVEDHDDSARLLARSLKRRGYRVVTAGSMQEAVEIYQKEPVDAVISDIGLPDGDGTTLMERLQTIRPVGGIALSGYGMEEDLVRSREAGFTEHLTKPVNWGLLETALTRLLADHPCRAPAGGG